MPYFQSPHNRIRKTVPEFGISQACLSKHMRMSQFERRYFVAGVCKLLLSLVLFFALCSHSSIAMAKGIIKVRVGIFNNKPMCYFDATGKPAGIFVAVIEYAAAKEGWELVYVRDRFSSLGTKLAKGKIDILLSTAVSEERKKLYAYNKINVFSNWAEIYVLPKSKINSLLDLQGKRVATLEKAIYSTGPEGIIKLNDKFNLNCKFTFVKDYKTGLESVREKSVDAAVVNRLVGAAYEREYGLVKSGIVFAPVSIRFALNKDNKNTPLLIAALDKHIASLLQNQNSVYHQAINKPLGGSNAINQKKFHQIFWTTLISGVVFITFLALLSFFLRWQIKRKTQDLLIAHEQLSKNEQKYRRLLESTSTVPWELDIESGRFTYIGNQIEHILGYTADSWTDLKVWSDRLHNEDREKSVRFCEIETSKGNDHDFIYRAIHKDGSIRWIRDIVSVVKESGEPQHLIGFMLDITKEKELSLEKEKLQKHLQQTQKLEAIGTLAGGIAHDFNNILGAILGYAEMARDDSPADSSIAHDLDRVLHAANRAKELVKQILAFSRTNDTERIPLHLAVILKEAIKILRPSLPSTIEINQDVNSQTAKIFADPTQMHQLLMNLCTNAFHAMEKTGGRLDISLIEIELQSEDLVHEPGIAAGKFVKLSIADSGPGIPPDIKDKIFEPFFTTKEVGKGTGMGLSIAHGIVKSYGGFISLYSEPGEGTVFHVFLPIIPHEALPQIEEIEKIPLGKEQVLFVDDEKLLVEMGRDMLNRLGYHVTARNNSLEALETFQNQPDQFDIVITDQTMPGMTGTDLARRMLQIRPDIPIILCTGYSSIITPEKAKSLGIKGFALKPLTKKDMARLIRKILDEVG